jgi:TRAP-type C4-dicarboxylate transport system substrate-binding protein
MTLDRRTFVASSLALGAGALLHRAHAAGTVLKISHQFPGGTLTEGDFRDRLCRMFAAEVERRTNGALKAQVYPGSSLMKTNAQFSALRKGALDMSLIPLSYGGGEVPEVNIGLMPGLVTSYEQGLGWKTKDVGRELTNVCADKGLVLVTWLWQAGGVASRTRPVVEPEDAKGMKIRGGSREVDMMLKAAGAAVVSLPSNEIYAAMQTGAVDAAMTSSTSLISFRLEEVSKHLTTGRGKAYWYMFEPLVISKSVFDALPKDMQAVVMAVGTELEKFALEGARADDQLLASVYQKAGAKVYDLTDATVKRWQAVARDTAWKDFAERGERSARLLKLAEQTL